MTFNHDSHSAIAAAYDAHCGAAFDLDAAIDRHLESDDGDRMNAIISCIDGKTEEHEMVRHALAMIFNPATATTDVLRNAAMLSKYGQQLTIKHVMRCEGFV